MKQVLNLCLPTRQPKFLKHESHFKRLQPVNGQQQIYCAVGCPVSQMFRPDLAFFVRLWSPSQGFGRGRCLMVSQDIQLPFAIDRGGRCQGVQRCLSGGPVVLGLHPRRLLFLVPSLLSFAFCFHLQLFVPERSRQGDPNSSLP